MWNKFFQDKELKGMIKQDVMRTSVSPSFCFSFLYLKPESDTDRSPFFLSVCVRFPEIRYFQDDDVRTKLTDILFCYARENEQLLYKQVGS